MELSILKQERLSRGWSRAQVEAKTGIPPRSLENWEGQQAWPRGENIEALCRLYGKTAVQLGLVRVSNYGMIGRRNQRQENSGALAISTPEGTNMSDFLKSSLRTDLSSQLNSILSAWPRRNLDFEDLQFEIQKAVTDYNACVEYDIAYAVTRRDACKSLMLVPLQLCGLGLLAQTSLIKMPKDTEGLLSRSAAGIAVCWYMRRGKDLSLAHEIVSWYIPILQAVLSSQAEKYRTAAATLLVQCFTLQGSLTRDIKNSDPLTSYERGMEYALLSGDPTVQATVHPLIASHLFLDKEDYAQALSHAEQACHFAKDAGRNIQSYTLANLSCCQAATGNASEALVTLDQARKLFDSSNLPITIQYSSAILAHTVGITQFHVGNYEEAANFYTQSIEAPDASALGKAQASIKRAMVEACRGDKPRDMKLALSYWEKGMLGAKEGESERLANEARKVYWLLVAAWPREDVIQKLRRHL